MDSKIAIFISLLVTTVFESCTLTKIFSYLDKNSEDENIPLNVRKKIEEIYVENYSTINEGKNDLICNLTNGEKQALCQLILKTKIYRNVGFYLNKAVHYVAKLSCKSEQIEFRYIDENRIIPVLQQMYPCYGRHEPVMTSIIEDQFYNFVFLSSGPFINSVTIYGPSSNSKNKYNVINYAYNVNLSELKYSLISIKEVNEELQTMKRIFVVSSDADARTFYRHELRNFWNDKDDPICNLEYEKKVTLCNIIFNESSKFDEIFNVALNKSATYIANMECAQKPVSSELSNPDYILHPEQNMFVCPSKYKQLARENRYNFLSADSFSTFYVSSSSYRNAVFVYFKDTTARNNQETFVVVDMIGNIDLKNLKRTNITANDLIAESKPTYVQLKRMIEGIRNKSAKELSSILVSCETVEQENERTKQLFLENAPSFSQITSQTQAQSTFPLGLQVYKRLLLEKKAALLIKELSGRLPENLVSNKSAKTEGISDFKNIKKEIQKLIARMESIVIKMIEKNIMQDRSVKQLKIRSKRKPKK